ncbi:hypothetical protein B0H21DRAFT_825475 [Amylocystis lapponica]|nr:hypothetical protein B0H21DRAFT_825475 [Amylocystis lapponica]
MLSVFKSKPTFDPSKLGAILAAWPAASAPKRFYGKPKKDLPIDEWLALIAAAARPRERVEELERVMRCVYGHHWGWKWGSFGVALKNMSWSIDTKRMKVVEVDKSSGIWASLSRALGQGPKDKDSASTAVVPKDKAAPKDKATPKDKAASKDKAMKDLPSKATKKVPDKSPAQPKRAATVPAAQKSDKQEGHTLTRALTRLATPLHLVAPPPPPPPATIIAQVPLWLLAASEAMAALTTDYSSTMSVLAAVLITVGSVPALPTVSAGATAHALGSVAVGLGALLRERARDGGN